MTTIASNPAPATPLSPAAVAPPLAPTNDPPLRPPNILEHYIALCWSLVRIPPLSKAPIDRDWPTIDYRPEHFAAGDNVGVKLGERSGGLVDVDLDCPEAIALAPYFLPPTATFGRHSKPASHWFYRCPGVKSRKPSRVHIELRSTGLQTVIPRSIHESGEPIDWTPACPNVLDITEAELLTAFGRLGVATIIARAWPRIEGGRHDATLALAGALFAEGWSQADTERVILSAAALTSPDPGHRAAAIRDTFDSSHGRDRTGWPTVAELIGSEDAKTIQRMVELVPTSPRLEAMGIEVGALTDTGNAERFAAMFGSDLRYAHGIGWLQWTGVRWEVFDAKHEPIDLAIRSARALGGHAFKSGLAKVRDFALASENVGKLKAALEIAKNLPSMRIKADDLDADPWLLNTPSETVDLRTGTLREHRREDLITKCTGVSVDPSRNCPRFAQFLGEIFAGDQDLALCCLRYLGTALTGKQPTHALQCWYGGGSNGKTTLLESILHVLGDYAQMIAASTLLDTGTKRNGGDATPDLYALRGVRFAAADESDAGQRWNEATIKKLTGGGRMTARGLHLAPVEFPQTWTIVLATNYKPLVRGTDAAIWNRLQLIPFDVSFAPRPAHPVDVGAGMWRDPSLASKLEAEAPAILGLLVQACGEWHGREQAGLESIEPPDKVKAASADYRASMDVVGSFLDECTERGPDFKAEQSNLYRAFKRWAEESGEYVPGKKAFNRMMEDRGWRTRKSGVLVWNGLRVRPTGLAAIQ